MNKFKITFLALLILLSAVFTAGNVLAATTFQGGNIYIVSNTNNPGPADPVDAQVSDIVEFRVNITNLGSETATNVRVMADLPTNVSGNTISSTIHIVADNASEITDTATVNVTNANPAAVRSLTYFPGHAFVITNSGQTSIEAIGGGGFVSIGDILVGASNYVEVGFKAQVTESVSPTPTPGSTATPTPTTTPGPTATPTQAPAGGQQQTQTQTQNVTINQPAAPAAQPAVVLGTKAPVVQPKSGPEVALLMSLFGMLPLGVWFKKKKF